MRFFGPFCRTQKIQDPGRLQVPNFGSVSFILALGQSGVATVSGVLLRDPGTKRHSNVGAAERHKEYYMGEGDGFPRVRAVVSFGSPELPMACLSTKGALESELTNLLVDLL